MGDFLRWLEGWENVEELGIAAPDDGTCPGGPCVPGQTDSAEFSAEVQFCLTGLGRPVAAGHETQTRTKGFHGCVASPVGCSGPAFRDGGVARGRSGVVDVLPLKNTTIKIML